MEEGAVTWRSAAGSLLRHNVRFLCALGVWPPAAPAPRAFRALTAALMALGAAHLVGAACSVYASSGDLQLLTLALSNAFPVSSGLAKAALLVARHRRYSSLVRGVDALRARQRDFCDADPQLAAALRETRRWSVKLTFLFFSSVLSALIVWSLLPLSMYPQVRIFPFQQLPWPNLTREPTYWFLYVHQCLATFFFCSIDMNTDCFFAAIMAHISMQFKVLASRIAGLRLRERSQKIKLCTESDDVSTLHGDMYNELCLCVDTHKELIRLVGLLESLMNPVTMLQFLVGAVSSCVVLFSATYSEAVAMAAYDCAWCDSSSKLKRALQLVISRAQKPLSLTAGKLYAVKRAAFLSNMCNEELNLIICSGRIKCNLVTQCCSNK
ncbi:odorant receptor 2a-like [Schistocerca gregaria]|uniref:odorant receptor 2a-like n=1 Tax=Schistocerca gregaria TaxID=7010 RepID=UPI00211E92FE|nr:odorant receptor 2a-like [Schistocerca gregaria]